MSTKFKLSLLFIAITILSCEKQSLYQNIIENKTSDTVSVYLKGTSAYVSQTDTIIALPNTQTIYYYAEGWRISDKNFDCNPQLSSSEITVVVSDGKTLIKDLTNNQNWNCETDRKNTYRKMIFSISDQDLQE